MVIPGTMSEKLKSVTVSDEIINGSTFRVYRIKGYQFILFKVDVELLNSFPMPEEEKDLGVSLCLEARLKNNVSGSEIF